MKTERKWCAVTHGYQPTVLSEEYTLSLEPSTGEREETTEYQGNIVESELLWLISLQQLKRYWHPHASFLFELRSRLISFRFFGL